MIAVKGVYYFKPIYDDFTRYIRKEIAFSTCETDLEVAYDIALSSPDLCMPPLPSPAAPIFFETSRWSL